MGKISFIFSLTVVLIGLVAYKMIVPLPSNVESRQTRAVFDGFINAFHGFLVKMHNVGILSQQPAIVIQSTFQLGSRIEQHPNVTVIERNVANVPVLIFK